MPTNKNLKSPIDPLMGGEGNGKRGGFFRSREWGNFRRTKAKKNPHGGKVRQPDFLMKKKGGGFFNSVIGKKCFVQEVRRGNSTFRREDKKKVGPI